MTSTLVQSAIAQLRGLGTIPAAAMRILAIAEDPALTESQMEEALALDPSLAARVLKVVNSAFYRRQREVGSCNAAIRLLGIAAIRNIAIASSLHRLFRAKRSIEGFDPTALWAHATAVAAISRELALHSGRAEPEEAMLAGLLHDFGIIAEAQLWPIELTKALQLVHATPPLGFRDAERLQLGMAHDEVGALLCSVWNLPPAFADVCRYHHDVEPALPAARADRAMLPLIVHIADVLAARASMGLTATVEHVSPVPEAIALLGLSEYQLAQCVDAAQEAVAPLAAMLAA